MFQILALPLLVFTTLTVESSDPVATSTLSLCASTHVIEPWWDVPSGEWSNYNLVFSYCLFVSENVFAVLVKLVMGLFIKYWNLKFSWNKMLQICAVYVVWNQTTNLSTWFLKLTCDPLLLCQFVETVQKSNLRIIYSLCLENCVMMTPKRWLLMLIFTCLCFKKSFLIKHLIIHQLLWLWHCLNIRS